MMEAIGTLNRYGLEVTSGIILGLDTDTANSEAYLKNFIDLSQIPVLTITYCRRCRAPHCGIASSAMAD
jgi:biotin synthase-like enzyme